MAVNSDSNDGYNFAPELDGLNNTCDSAIELASLFEDILKKGVTLKVRVTGQSMGKSIGSGDVVLIQEVHSSDLTKGDILLIRGQTGSLILHRLLRTFTTASGKFVQTKGDSLSHLDTPVPVTDILGRATVIEKRGSGNRKRVILSTFSGRCRNYLTALSQLFHIVLQKVTMRLQLHTDRDFNR